MEFYYTYSKGIAKVKVEFRERKTLKLSIKDSDTIEVVSPKFLKDEQKIREVIDEKRIWIEKQLDFYKENLEEYINREYKTGEKFLYLGDEYSLIVEKNPKLCRVEVDNKNKKLYVTSPNIEGEYIKRLLVNFYKEQTTKEVRQAIKKFQTYFSMKPIEVVVKDQKSRWGSCTYKNKILFNFRISMADREVIEYVVIHEMCHMVHKNHSKDFWDLVKHIMPDYKSKDSWLKKNGLKMNI